MTLTKETIEVKEGKAPYDKAGRDLICKASPSELIEIALADLEAVEADEDYLVYMDDWHRPISTDWFNNGPLDKCAVCFAGAVMATTLQVPWAWNAEPEDINGASVENRLLALNEFRKGRVLSGLSYMNKLSLKTEDQICEDDMEFWPVCPYEKNAERFKLDMRYIAEYLKSIGL